MAVAGRRQRPRPTALLVALGACSFSRDVAVAAFRLLPSHYSGTLQLQRVHNNVSAHSRKSSTSLHMVFDFLKKAQAEAEEQMTAFATGLAKSRNQFLYNLEEVGTGGNLLDRLEDTLLQADLGLATTDDVLEEARFLREESTEIFGRDEVRALLRGKLLEGLGADAGGPAGTGGRSLRWKNPWGRVASVTSMSRTTAKTPLLFDLPARATPSPLGPRRP